MARTIRDGREREGNKDMDGFMGVFSGGVLEFRVGFVEEVKLESVAH